MTCLINKIIGGEAPPDGFSKLIELNKNNLRSNEKLIIWLPTNNFHKTSFCVGAPVKWNKVPDDIWIIRSSEKFKDIW